MIHIYNLFNQSKDRSRQRKLVYSKAKRAVNKYNACPMPQIKHNIHEICTLFKKPLCDI